MFQKHDDRLCYTDAAQLRWVCCTYDNGVDYTEGELCGIWQEQNINVTSYQLPVINLNYNFGIQFFIEQTKRLLK